MLCWRLKKNRLENIFHVLSSAFDSNWMRLGTFRFDLGLILWAVHIERGYGIICFYFWQINCVWRKRGKRSGCPLRICRRWNKPPLPSILLANVQSLYIEIDELRGRLNYQWDIKNCNIFCFTESWLNDDNINIQLTGYTLYRQDRTAASGKTRGGGLSIL